MSLFNTRHFCDMPSPRFLRHFLAFDFAVSEINRNADILPNVTLGYDMFDSCFFEDTAVEGSLRILSGGVKMYPNYDCHGYGKVVAFIGHLLSSSSQAIASLLRVYGYPQTPRSVCSEDCIPGYRKSLVKGKPVCCFVCAPCSEGEITNTTDTETCIICPEEEWPNEKKDRCVKRVTLFLNIQDPLGTLLLASTGVFFIMTTVVLAIFIKHRDTPIVRANNIHVSFILIISLMFSFLCVLLFIGRPTVLSCLLRQVVFCLIFTLAISSTLAKTIIVLVAFTSTKPGGISKNWMGSSLSRLIIFICCLGQVLICSVWLLQSPPFPDKDTRSEVGKIILQCNEGSTTAFYAALGYMGFLAVSSFILAFLVRKLPDCFNEAHYITFSMLVFCSVWVTFIPVYLRTKGKYTVAVEVFAILASSAGLLFCLFIPKCFTIIIRPERNSRESVSDRKLH
ncbi:vomeronasal type-2 receptor 26-like isoform X3 [Mixophyes fleayi]|uniref:vomeronasal type-2 receptor 26-like isoform X3 n=1 Tax=Mixophyes fleayi TaxID=3061075 RepID=UPI003F4E321A